MSERVALVTGFGPFLDVSANPSERVVRRLEGRWVAGARVRGAVLPVAYHDGPAALDAAIAAHRPACVIALGAGRGDAIALETRAQNRARSEHPDAAGVVLSEYTLEADGPDERRCGLPLAEWAQSLAAEGTPVVASDDAGGYVCNATYLALLRHEELRSRSLFVHLPRRLDDAAIDAAERVVLALLTRLLGPAEKP